MHTKKCFVPNCESLYVACLSYGNPFEETHPGLVHQISKQILSEEAAKSACSVHAIGKEQYSKFNTTYFSTNEKMLLVYQKASSRH